MNDIQTLLQGYRVKFGLEQQEAKGAIDPFSNTQEQFQPQQGLDWMPGQMPTQPQAITSAAEINPRDKRDMEDFFRMADKDPILSKDLDKRNAAMMEIHGMLVDPSNPMDDSMADSMVREIENKVYGGMRDGK